MVFVFPRQRARQNVVSYTRGVNKYFRIFILVVYLMTLSLSQARQRSMVGKQVKNKFENARVE
jgi:hypothetical protein